MINQLLTMTLESRKRQGTWHGAFTNDTRKRFENYYIGSPSMQAHTGKNTSEITNRSIMKDVKN